MKKLLTAMLMVFCLAFAAVASASPSVYKHPSYNFANVNKIIITQVYDDEDENSEYRHDRNAATRVLTALLGTANKYNVVMVDETRHPAESYEAEGAPHGPKIIELRVTINDFGTKEDVIPGYYKTVTHYETEYYYDAYGVRQQRRYPVSRQEWVPETRYNIACIDIIYSFYDLIDGTMIASISDKRVRDFESETTGMTKRSANDVFKNLFKK